MKCSIANLIVIDDYFRD